MLVLLQTNIHNTQIYMYCTKTKHTQNTSLAVAYTRILLVINSIMLSY